jgi:hypothetical protein
MDQYKGSHKSWSTGTGWHYGGGSTLPIAGPILLRFDFKSRFGPGNSLYVGVGIVYRLPSSSASAP